jgi:DNA-binding MarR family transcriptional regulator
MPTVTRQASATTAELASVLRPALLRLTRILRNQRADTSVTLTHISALVTLKKSGPMSAGDLAASERVQPPSMTKVLATLEQRGLVRREPHPTDGRSSIIAITPEGQALLDSERQRRDAWLTQRLARLSADERAALRSVIPILDKLAEAE